MATAPTTIQPELPSRPPILQAVRSPLGFFTLAVLIAEALLILVLTTLEIHADERRLLVGAMIGLIFLLVLLVAGMAFFRRETLYEPAAEPAERAKRVTEIIEKRVEKAAPIAYDDQPPPPAGAWYKDLQPVLHQAIHYTVPTYYLNMNLMIVDWNLAFDLIFSGLAPTLRDKHVKYFIAALKNFRAVMDHAQTFSRDVANGYIPFVDVEPLKYTSEKYGETRFLKVATQLHGADGSPKGWSVSLMIQEIDWAAFQGDLLEEARKDKLWYVYSAAYDRILTEYEPYKKLIQDVTRVVPSGGQSVVDLGAGTGNVTAALLEAGHTVTAVENNMGMLDRLRAKDLSRTLTVVKSSVENLSGLPTGAYDSAVAVNVLYAVDDPLACLREVHRILKPNGTLSFSTTHAETDLDRLLKSIRKWLVDTGRYSRLKNDYQIIYDVNKNIEKSIARRHTREDYREWVRTAGFEITNELPSTYEDAVMLIEARRDDRS